MKKIMSFTLLLSIIFTMCIAPTFANSIQTARNIEDYIILENNILSLSDEINLNRFPNDDIIFVQSTLDNLNQLIASHKIMVNPTTLEVTKLRSRSTRDVEVGEWKQIAYFSHDAVDKISTAIGLSGGTISIRSLIGIIAKAIKDGGITALAAADLIAGTILLIGCSNMVNACEDGDHEGAYLHRYGNNNVFMFSHKEDLGY